ncbi:anti-sigma factor family protein [Caenispirillum bisanense]|uniref:Zinc-finger n=1 Tax=Caenispirillum bisanense TaxID=414052 RepID=A0A286GJY7_9PROT|nr:hypothetical protein [Caenispirillum bisanense]SOD95851.1 hypothetical protein SAMN05421508_10528 [Caenispirillum bisanense]
MTSLRQSGAVETLDATIDDYLAGRLTADERSRLETLIEENPEVRRRVDVLRAQEEALRHLGSDILDEPVPDRLLQALGLDD